MAQREEKRLFRAGKTAEMMSAPDIPAATRPAGLPLASGLEHPQRWQGSKVAGRCRRDDSSVREAQKADALSGWLSDGGFIGGASGGYAGGPLKADGVCSNQQLVYPNCSALHADVGLNNSSIVLCFIL